MNNSNFQHKWALIINPFSGKNRKQNQFKKLIVALEQKNIEFTSQFTEYAGHLSVLLENLLQKGFRKFIISGGDGTFGDTANALYHQKIVAPLDITFAFIPAGTGNDWAKTMQLPSKIEKLVNLIAKGYTIRQDLGKISCLNNKQIAFNHYFINIAGMGFDTYISEKYLSHNKTMGAFTYYYYTAKGLLEYDNHEFTIEYEDQNSNWQTVSGKLFEVAFGICKYFGGGMKITPNASPISGLIDLTIIKDVTKYEGLSQLPRMLNGAFIDFYKVETALAKKVRLSAPITEKIQADGELIGFLPAEIEIIPKAMNIVVSEKISF